MKNRAGIPDAPARYVHRIFPGLLLLWLAGFGIAQARPAPPTRPDASISAIESESPDFLITGPSAISPNDTAWYGGTVWAPDSNRWEAIPGGIWTFDSGVGSALQLVPDISGKPVGYHRLMEGWVGRDGTLPDTTTFRRISTCAITGSYSLWLGKTFAEANALGWAAGQGYGNSWNGTVEQTFAYSGSGDVTLTYQYAVEAESGFDYARVAVRPSGAANDIVLRTRSGITSGSDTIVLKQVDGTLPPGAGTITIRFNGTSDGSYSDEDGLNPTVCGLYAVDNITLSGAVTHSATFETGMDGWAPGAPLPGVGDYSDIRDVNTLPPVTGFFCSDCGLRDSVLVFLDPNGMHPPGQSDYAISPWIDLKATGDDRRPGRILDFSVYAQASVTPPITIGWQYYPYIYPTTGLVGISPIFFSNIFFFGGPVCASRYLFNIYASGSEQMRVVVGMNETIDSGPYIDNVRVGAYGPATAPSLSVNYLFQDAFATDGTLDPASTGRLDTERQRVSAPLVLADTLYASGGNGNTEVRIAFHVRPGPLTSPSGLANAALRWTAEPSIGTAWYSARMDTAEDKGVGAGATTWMTAFHESDPGFQGTDTSLDGTGGLSNDVLPDQLLTPGARIDYFLMSRYIPPDPRNAGGVTWFVIPDTTGARYWEAEILPSSMTADTTWNCVLAVEAHSFGDEAAQKLEESALHYALGPGGNNAEGTRYDRWDARVSLPFSLGRAAGSVAGASSTQVAGYMSLLWYAGRRFGSLLADDVAILDAWLKTPGVDRRFWANGAEFAASANSPAGTQAFLNGTLGVLLSCSTARGAGCPSGSALDSTYCLPLTAAALPAFTPTGQASVGENGCPGIRSFDVLAPNPGVPTAAGNLSYVKNGSPAPYASVTNDQPAGFSYRTVTDGFPVSLLRRTPATPHDPAACSNVTPVYERTLDVLRWFGPPDCATGVTGVPEPEPPANPASRPWLGDAFPNPMTSSTRIAFSTGRSTDAVILQIFDVSGRLVRTLRPGAAEIEKREITWDGRTDAGSGVTAGLYFYRMTSGVFSATKKLLVVE